MLIPNHKRGQGLQESGEITEPLMMILICMNGVEKRVTLVSKPIVFTCAQVAECFPQAIKFWVEGQEQDGMAVEEQKREKD